MSVQFTQRLSRRPAKFTNQIRSYRLRAGLSQRELGISLGLGRHAVSSWERGQSCPSTPVLMRLAKCLATLAESLYPEYYGARTEPRTLQHV